MQQFLIVRTNNENETQSANQLQTRTTNQNETVTQIACKQKHLIRVSIECFIISFAPIIEISKSLLSFGHCSEKNFNFNIHKNKVRLVGTRSIDQITFFQNSFFSFECRSFEKRCFCTFFWIRLLSKKMVILKENRTKNNLYKWTKIFFWLTFFQKSFFFQKFENKDKN
jgi:hypothetical protein